MQAVLESQAQAGRRHHHNYRYCQWRRQGQLECQRTSPDNDDDDDKGDGDENVSQVAPLRYLWQAQPFLHPRRRGALPAYAACQPLVPVIAHARHRGRHARRGGELAACHGRASRRQNQHAALVSHAGA